VLYGERKENGQYKDLEDLLVRIKDRDLNKKSLESLIKCGAFDSFGFDRGMLLGNIDNLQSFFKLTHENSNSPQNSLFAGTTLDTAKKIRFVAASPCVEADKLSWEKELLGLYVSAHPFSKYQKMFQRVLTPINELSSKPRSTWVVVGGVIDSTKKKITRAGKAMLFVNMQDTSGGIELLVFPRTYETTKDIWVVGALVCVMAKTSEEDGDDKLFVEKGYTLTPQTAPMLLQQLSAASPAQALRQYAGEVGAESARWVELPDGGVQIEVSSVELARHSEALKEIFVRFPGQAIVFLKVGDKRIKTASQIAISPELKQALEALGIKAT
jgi:DNA polymerase III alpha subunit